MYLEFKKKVQFWSIMQEKSVSFFKIYRNAASSNSMKLSQLLPESQITSLWSIPKCKIVNKDIRVRKLLRSWRFLLKLSSKIFDLQLFSNRLKPWLSKILLCWVTTLHSMLMVAQKICWLLRYKWHHQRFSFLTFCFYFFLTCLFCLLVCMIETNPSFWTTVGNHFLIWIQELAHALFYSIYKTFQNVKLRLLYRYINLLKFDLLKCGNPKRKNVVFCMICLF